MRSEHWGTPLVFTAALVAAAGCKGGPDGKGEGGGAADVAGDEMTPTRGTEAAGDERIALAESPAIDLVKNRYLLHLHRAGLIIPFASEGIRKYEREYARPWKQVVEVGGEAGRVLSRRQTTLEFHWFDEAGPATLALRAHGAAAGQKATLRLNGKPLSNVSIPDEWATTTVDIPTGVLVAGENELSLHMAKAGSAGGAKTYALFHSIEIVPQDATAVAEPPPLVPVVASEAGGRPGLTGVPRLVYVVEIPDSGVLEVGTSAPGKAEFSVHVTPAKGERQELLKRSIDGESPVHQIDLSPYGGQIVALELSSSGEGASWVAPRIALRATGSMDRPKPPKNLILIVVDALRSDKLSLYADVYGKEAAVRTPRMNEYAEKGSATFLHNQAASPSSPPSHGSIQTGMIPRVHGVSGDKGQVVPGTPTVSTQLVGAGISAGYFGNNPFGMARHQKAGRWTAFHQPGMEGKSNDCTTLMDMMLEFAVAESGKGKRFFISSLPYETHTPYRYHEGITEHYYDGDYPPPVGKSVDGNLLSALNSKSVTLTDTQWRQLKGLYDGEAEYMDGCFGQLVDGLAEAGILDDTAIIVTSDHGEGMFEHENMGHAWGHNRELGDVPFVIMWPALGKGARTLDSVASHLDITPTILDILGVKVAPEVQGISVLPEVLREGPWIPRVVSLEYGRSYSLRSRTFKMIVGYNGEQQYYDLEADLWETRDARGENSLGVRYLRDFAGFFLEHRSSWRGQTWGSLNHLDDGFLAVAEGE